MRISTLKKFFLSIAVVSFAAVACKKDDPAKLAIPPTPDQSFVEEFDTASSAFARGWFPINNSNPKGSSVWMQGGGPVPFFRPYSSRGSFAGFIGSDYLSTSADAAVISNWLISPPVLMKNGDKIIFYTRAWLLPNAFQAGDSTDYGNNLEVCINRKNDGTNVGIARDPRDASYNSATDRGDFEALLSINPPTYNAGIDYFDYHWAHTTPSLFDPRAFPAAWTRFEVAVDGINNPPHKGRFAFRYYTLDAGSNGNGSGVGIDSVVYISSH